MAERFGKKRSIWRVSQEEEAQGRIGMKTYIAEGSVVDRCLIEESIGDMRHGGGFRWLQGCQETVISSSSLEILLRLQLWPKCVAFPRELYFLIVFWKKAGLIDGRLGALRCLYYRLPKRWVLRGLALVYWSWWVEALGVCGSLYEFWQFVCFKELVHFICVFKFLAMKLFILFLHYSFNVYGNPHGPSLICVCFSISLSLFLVSLARGYQLLLLLIFSIVFIFSISLISALIFIIFSSVCTV